MTSKISPDDVKHLAQLSKLKLSTEEATKFAPQLEEIVQFFSQLQEVGTENIIETSQTTELENIWRKDEINRCSYEKELIKCSPHPIKKEKIHISNIQQ
jgi:aspartyl-tRNA(Asn)/glutamyl-tRNA(Gln) amidotransferase subunit C